MYIARVALEDIRCFRGRHELDLKRPEGSYAGWTVFAGRNGAGKTSLLQALAVAVSGEWLWSWAAGEHWVSHGQKRAGLECTLFWSPDHGDRFASDESRELAPPEATEPTEMTVRHGWKRAPDGENWFATRSNYHPARAKEGFELGPWLNRPSGWFAAGYGASRDITGKPQSSDGYTSVVSARSLYHLMFPTAQLSDAVDWLKQVHLEHMEENPRSTKLRGDILRILDDGLLPDHSRVLDVRSDGLQIKRDGVVLPLARVSDGYRTVTALVLDIVRRLHQNFGDLQLEAGPDGGVVCPLHGVVLIDEIDAHLHVSWQQRIGVWLTAHFPNIQFLVTTHSPFICQAASPGGLFRLPAPGEDRKIEPVPPRVWQAIVNGSADDAVMSELFDLEHPHSRRAEEKRQRLAKLEAQLLLGESTVSMASTNSGSASEEYEQLRDELGANLGDLARIRLQALLGEDA